MAMSSVKLSIVDISQVNIEELIRDIREKVMRLLKIIMENNTKILELQKMLVIVIVKEKMNSKKKIRES